MRILIFGRNRALHEKIHRRGHDLILFISQTKVIVEDLRGIYKDVIVLNDDASNLLCGGIAEAMHNAQPFDIVAAYDDSGQELAHEVAQKLGVPCSVDIRLFELVNNKHLMRQTLDERGIPNCRYIHAENEADIRTAIKNIGHPCIVKPIAGEASEGVAKISNESDIRAALEWVGAESVRQGVLIEEFLTGDEYSVEAITCGGVHHILAITKKFKDPITFVEVGHLVQAPLEVPQRDAIAAYVKSILTAFGYQDCPSHTELILTANGPRIIETHTRVGGDCIVDLVQLATGIDLYDLVAQQSVGQDISKQIPANVPNVQSAAVWFADPSMSSDLQLSEIRGFEAASAPSHVKKLKLLKQQGARGSVVRSSFDRSAFAVAVGETPEDALARAQEAIRILEFIYVWNPENKPDSR